MSYTLTRQSVAAIHYDDCNRHVWPLLVTATSSNTLSAKIFVYHAQKLQGTDTSDVFECVASVQQLRDLPADQPVANPPTPYYRKSSLEVHCRSPQEAEELWVEIQKDVQDLLNNEASRAHLAASETVILT